MMNVWRRVVKMLKNRTDHVTRTADSFRHVSMTKGKITNLSRLSPNVRGLTVEAECKVDFKAGQWIDLRVPEYEEIGGYSICSAPYEMKKYSTLLIAVKFVSNTPAEWCHNCDLKSEVEFRVGGDFYFQPDQDHSTKSLILIGGGVGVNPLRSIIKQTLYADDHGDTCRQIFLLYSAKNEIELLFKDDFNLMNEKFENFKPKFFVSQQQAVWSGNYNVETRRMNEKDIDFCLDQIKSRDDSKIFVCGPPALSDFVINYLHKIKYPEDCIFYEKWW